MQSLILEPQNSFNITATLRHSSSERCAAFFLFRCRTALNIPFFSLVSDADNGAGLQSFDKDSGLLSFSDSEEKNFTISSKLALNSTKERAALLCLTLLPAKSPQINRLPSSKQPFWGTSKELSVLQSSFPLTAIMIFIKISSVSIVFSSFL